MGTATRLADRDGSFAGLADDPELREQVGNVVPPQPPLTIDGIQRLSRRPVDVDQALAFSARATRTTAWLPWCSPGASWRTADRSPPQRSTGEPGQKIVARASGAMSTATCVFASSSTSSPSSCSGMGASGVNA